VSEEQDRVGPGWLVTLLGGAVLVLLGFGLGLVVGAAREEPELVFRHFSGESKEVPAPAASPGPTSPSESPSGAPPPAGAPAPTHPLNGPTSTPPAADAEGESARTPSAESAPPALHHAPPPVSAPPPASSGQRFSVQVGAFAESADAQKLADHLRHEGMRVVVVPATGPRDSRWRVRVGPLRSRDEANRVAQQLKTSDKLPTWVLAEGR
jgi:cell division septation protein DedD